MSEAHSYCQVLHDYILEFGTATFVNDDILDASKFGSDEMTLSLFDFGERNTNLSEGEAG
jgi:hypothetical protein